MACLWNPKYALLEHKYGRNQWKMSKIGQNSMKKWPFFAIILPWMARYGSKRSFLLIFSARDDLVKVSWKSDVGKCQNQLTPPYFDQLSERHQLLCEKIKELLYFAHSTTISEKSHCPYSFWLPIKGSHPLRKVQFFLTLFKRPLTPPPLSFEHHAEFAVSAGSENLI